MKNVTLKSGRVVNHRPTGNQTSVTALMEDGQDMTEAEWEEYCAIVVKRNAAKIRRQERDAAMRACGLTKVQGNLGTVFWE